MEHKRTLDRRAFLKKTSTLMAGTATGLAVFVKPAIPLLRQEKDEEVKVSPAEDLMREHGVLKRVLLVYQEIDSRLTGGKNFPLETLTGAADIIKNFIEDYHEKLEENYLFPRFRKAGKLTELVSVLETQHDRGRTITDFILKNAPLALRSRPDADTKRKLIDSIRQFVRMYNPHEAREDTVLFPAFRTIVPESEYDSLGEEFEKQEQDKFGEDGFEKYVAKVAGLEKSLDIYDLAMFTPKVS